MIGLSLPGNLSDVVCLGAHPDDIEIGAAATLARIGKQRPQTRFTFVVLAGDAARRSEAEASARDLLGDRAEVHCGGFRDGFLPYGDAAAVKEFLLEHVDQTSAQLVFAPHTGDLHQDHALVGHMARQVFRDQIILEYELAKFDGGLGQPTVFVPIQDEEREAKIAHLMSHFASQHEKAWYTEKAFESLARLRGVECNSPSGYAEAFHTTKVVVDTS